MSTLGERIKSARERKGLYQSDLASLIGVKSAAVISNWEKDLNKPDAEKIVRLCGVLDVSASYLLDYYGKSNFELSPDEQEHIRRYKELDDHGRKMVDSVLAHESDRVKALEDQARKILELQRAIIPHYIMAYYEKMASAGSGEYLFDDIPTDLIEVPDCPMAHKADFVIGVTGRSMEPTYCDGDKVYVKKMAEIPTGSIGIFVRGNECFIKELGVDRLISHNKDCPDIPASDDIQLVGKVLGKVEEA